MSHVDNKMKRAMDLEYGERTEHGRIGAIEENGNDTVAIGFQCGGWAVFRKGELVRVFVDGDARYCKACHDHYGDNGVCDRGRPLGSPHRAK